MRFLSLSILLVLVGCSVDDRTSSKVSAEENLVSEETKASLVGTYAMTASLRGSADYPAPVGKVSTVSRSYRLAKIELNEGKLTIREENCGASIASDSSFKLRSHPKVQQSANVIEAELAVSEESGKLSITRPLATQVVGAELSDLDNEKLPTDANDKRLIQYENFDSGRGDLEKYRGAKSIATFTTPSILLIPGITISSDVFFAFRSKSTYSAVLDTKGNLNGWVSDTTEQSVVAVSNIIASGAKGSSTVVTPKDQGSVSLVRIEDSATCDTVLSSVAAQ